MSLYWIRVTMLCACVFSATVVYQRAAFGDDLAPLSDEFDDAGTVSDWSRINVTEQWFADQLEQFDVSVSQLGRMVLMPFTVVWYGDFRGPLVYKEVMGDFVVTTQVRSTGRDGVSVPQSQYSLAGLMIRAPRGITPPTWMPGGENYVFFSLGHGDNGGTSFQVEVKTTMNSVSNLTLTNVSADTAILQIARLGDYVIVLRQEPGEPWIVHRRYNRSDFPSTLQVGAVSYTNWEKAQTFAPFVHNSTVLDPPLPPEVTDPSPGLPFNPDVIGSYDYIRFFRPTLPADLVGVDLTDEGLVTDEELLAFLGDVANVPAGVPAVPTVSTWGAIILLGLMLIAGTCVFRFRNGTSSLSKSKRWVARPDP